MEKQEVWKTIDIVCAEKLKLKYDRQKREEIRMKFKRLTAVFLVILLMFSLAACKKPAGDRSARILTVRFKKGIRRNPAKFRPNTITIRPVIRFTAR